MKKRPFALLMALSMALSLLAYPVSAEDASPSGAVETQASSAGGTYETDPDVSSFTPAPSQTAEPTTEPTAEPVVTDKPSAPTKEPTAKPTSTPGVRPTPTARPKATPHPAPTGQPTARPTATPRPTTKPTARPTATPRPTTKPTATPRPTATARPTATPRPAVAAGSNLSSGSTAMKKLSREEIVTLLDGAPTTLPDQVFVTEPSCTAPFAAGQVKTEALQAATKRLNALRRLAGVPEVTLDTALSQNAQYGAVIQGTNGGLSHTPTQPDGMSDEFYKQAYSASSSSNLSAGRTLIVAVDGLMHDDSGSNLTSLGHRRWQLNPTMGKVGFGYAKSGSGYGSYVAEKVFDTSGKGCDYNFIAWPASGYFPQSQFGATIPWSVTLDPTKYSKPSASEITVTLKRESDGQSWTFNNKESYSTGSRDKYFNVNNSNYGVANCIIFRPDAPGTYTGAYTVTIDGLKDSSGSKVSTFSYRVEFFDDKNFTPAQDKELEAVSEWGREEVAQAFEEQLVPEVLKSDYQQNITRLEYCRLMTTLVARRTGKTAAEYAKEKGTPVAAQSPFTDTSDADVLAAYALGIVKGTSDTTFTPDGSITRQEAATMLCRTARVLGMTSGVGAPFLDSTTFPIWAKEGITFISGMKDPKSGKAVMEGTGGGNFSPLMHYSREQAFITAIRLFHCGK